MRYRGIIITLILFLVFGTIGYLARQLVTDVVTTTDMMGGGVILLVACGALLYITRVLLPSMQPIPQSSESLEEVAQERSQGVHILRPNRTLPTTLGAWLQPPSPNRPLPPLNKLQRHEILTQLMQTQRQSHE